MLKSKNLIGTLLWVICSNALAVGSGVNLINTGNVTYENTKNSNIIHFLNEYTEVSKFSGTKVSVVNVKHQSKKGYSSIELMLDMDLEKRLLNFNLLTKDSIKPELVYLNGSREIKLYHHLPTYGPELKYGVMLFVKINNQVRVFPLINLTMKSFYIKTNKQIYIPKVKLPENGASSGEFWLEVGVIDKDHKFGVKESL